MNQDEVTLVFKPTPKNCVGCVFYSEFGCHANETTFPCCIADREDKQNGIWVVKEVK